VRSPFPYRPESNTHGSAAPHPWVVRDRGSLPCKDREVHLGTADFQLGSTDEARSSLRLAPLNADGDAKEGREAVAHPRKR